jgi:hypothetical protein
MREKVGISLTKLSCYGGKKEITQLMPRLFIFPCYMKNFPEASVSDPGPH